MNFFPLSWHERIDSYAQFITTFGWAEDGAYCCLIIEGFTPFLYVKLRHLGDIEQIKRLLRSKPIFHNPIKLVERRGLYSNALKGIEKYAFISFKNTIARNGAVKVLNRQYMLCENKASATLQMACARDINLADWFRAVVGEPEVDKVTACEREYRLHFKDLFACEHKPAFIPTPVVMAYDIETFAHDVSIFPDANHPEDLIFQISVVVSSGGTRQKLLLTMGTPNYDLLDESLEVYTFTSEMKMLLFYADLVRRFSPQILIGYNTYGFDNKYMVERAKYLFVLDDFSRQGFTRDKAKVSTINWSSSAYSNQEMYYLDVTGRIHLDLLVFIKREYPFENYKLNSVAMHFLGAQKDPLNHYHIRECYLKGMEDPTAESRALSYVGTYCVKDSVLVLDIYEKIRLWDSIASMAAVCNMPILDLYTHGQTRKIFYQVYDYCVHNNIIVENDFYRAQSDEIVEGAVVLQPKGGLYRNAVSFDFASLYPSIIISHNIDFSTLVQPEDKVADEDCHVVEWETHWGCECEGADKAKKMRDGTKITICKAYRVRWLREPRGVIPTIIERLLVARKAVRAQQKSLDPESAEWRLLEKRQLAFKVSANSMFGGFSSKFGSLQFLIGGMCITAVGRRSVRKVADIMEKVHKAEVLYGDSVVASTPILVRYEGKIRYVRIDEIPVDWNFFAAENKSRGVPPEGYEVWSDKGWTAIKYVMRHRTRKQLVKVTTGSGQVTVTEEHSLLRENGEMCSPHELRVGNALLHSDLPDSCETAEGSYSELHSAVWFLVQKPMLDNANIVLSLEYLKCHRSQLVYDLETENHHFAAGVGRLVVHNTDSVYMRLSEQHMTPDEMYQHSVKLADEVSKHFPRPMKLEFEGKVYEKYFLFTKKRYIYKMVGKEDLKVSGVLLKRRDHSLIVKEMYKDLVDCCFRFCTEETLWTHFYDNMAILLAGYRAPAEYAIGRSVKTVDSFELRPRNATKVHFGSYIIAKLSSDEKKRLAQLKKKGARDELEFCYKSLPNHVQLALKMRARGQTLQNGERLSFLYIKGDKRAPTVDKMEDLEFFQLFYDNSYIDTGEYFRLLCEKPLTELFNVYLKRDHTKFFTNIWKAAAARNILNDEFKRLLRPTITLKED